MEYPGTEKVDQPHLDIDEVHAFIKDEWLMLAKGKVDEYSQSGDAGMKRFYVRLTSSEYKVTFTKLVMGPLGKPITLYKGVSIEEAVKYYNGERKR